MKLESPVLLQPAQIAADFADALAATLPLQARFDALHRAARAQIDVPRALREDRLNRLRTLVKANAEAFAAAISADFGHRSAHETRLAEVFPSLEALRHARRHVGGWMKPRRVSTSLLFRPGRARLIPQPLGAVGIIVPWNYPLMLAVSPLAAALAAGNRVMLKMSEFTPRFGELLAQRVAELFAPDEVTVVNGDASVGAAFAALPFDHLLFTGSTGVGRHIMHAAADHLTPVTLELGGKSPALIGPDYPLARAVERILAGKLLNAGQTCIAPDYVLLPAGDEAAFVELARATVQRMFPDLARTPDYSAIVNDRHFGRLQGLLDDAAARGARLEPLSDLPADPASRRFPPVLLRGVHDGMQVMREEIFGPLLPLVPYRDFGEALAYVNDHPRPLALYLFDNDSRRQQQVLHGTVAGGVTVNDTLLHIAQENLPFGGVGPSGMGHYHGEEGFRTFSKMKGVFLQSPLNGMALFNPPYGRLMDRLLAFLTR
ncbi:MAG: coniferyl aldehyde dehydrogenase [Leptothrix sp. (in: Bacteria)]|nr:coniferyl aldehyde dehydrogenase [Leptothrix sp. (in: b-proteobacteria)]